MSEKIFDLIIKNLKKPQFWIAIISIVIVFLLIFPYLDANVFYYNRIEKRIEILSALTELDMTKINDNPVLLDEYNALVNDIENQRDKTLQSVFTYSSNNSNDNPWYKFISGGILAWILALCVPFMKNMTRKNKLIAFIFIAIFGAILGAIAQAIPTIINPWINYIGFNVLLMLPLLIAAVSSVQKKSEG